MQEGSVTKAAEKLYLTQPALSQSIRRIEKHIGSKLFREEGKRLVLTQNGKELVIVMQRIVHLWQGMIQKKNSFHTSSFTIGMYDNAALRLSLLCKKYFESKTIALDIIIDNSDKLFSQLTHGILDICICIFDKEKKIPQNSELIATYDELLIPVSSHQWGKNITQIPFIFYNRDSITRKYIEREFIKHAIQPTIIAESTSPDFIKQLALVGSGVALLPKNFVKNELENKELYFIDLPLQFFRTVGMYKNKTNTTDEIDLFIKDIKEYLLP